MMKIFVILITFISFNVSAEENVWTPKALFKIENDNLQQTMLFVSGMSYGLTEYSRRLKEHGKARLFCTRGSDLVTSKMIFEILNEKYTNQKITAEQAIGAVMTGLQNKYPCPQNKIIKTGRIE